MSLLVKVVCSVFLFLSSLSLFAKGESELAFLSSCDTCCEPVECQKGFCNLSFYADYLYWRVRSDGLPYVITSETIPGGLETKIVERVVPSYSSGVRLGLENMFSCFDYWCLSAEWTYFSSRDTDTTNGSVLLPIWPSQILAPVVTNSDGEYTLRLNILDVMLKRSFYPLQRLSLSPGAGVRGLWIDEDLNATYRGGNIAIPFNDQNSIDLHGWGLRAGFATQWFICSGFHLLGWSYVDLLWSHLKIRQLDFFETGGLRSSIRDDIHTAIPSLELFVGLGWERTICNWNVAARIGWEQQYFLNAIQFNRYTQRGSDDIMAQQTSGLALGGLTVGVGVGF